jgi:hypothetical protein
MHERGLQKHKWADREYRAEDARIRYSAGRQGFVIRRSGSRDPRSPDYGRTLLLRVREYDELTGWRSIPTPEVHGEWVGPFHELSEIRHYLTRGAEGIPPRELAPRPERNGHPSPAPRPAAPATA